MQTGDFDIAQAMAQAWVRQRTDHNEIAKSVRYLTEHPNGQLFFRYLSTVVQEGQAVVRSGRSLDYYRQIEQVCREHLAPYQEEPEKMAQILGWAVRLMRYYLGAPNLQKPPIPGPEVRQTAPRPTSIPSADRHTGQVKWFNDQKGFGFIQPNDSEQDVFVHISSLAPGVNTLLPGQQVEFEIGPGRKGPQALNVRLVP